MKHCGRDVYTQGNLAPWSVLSWVKSRLTWQAPGLDGVPMWHSSNGPKLGLTIYGGDSPTVVPLSQGWFLPVTFLSPVRFGRCYRVCSIIADLSQTPSLQIIASLQICHEP